MLINKGLVWFDEQTVSRVNADSKLLGKICKTFAALFVLIMAVTYIVTSSVSESTFIKRERFDDPDEFIEYMQSEYDAWYNEGYGDLPPNERPMHGSFKKWGEINGKEYYYNPMLYESINVGHRANGYLEIVVTTEDADQNGQAMYAILMAGLLSLHVINLAVCVIWYLVGTKKRKTA